MSKTKTRLVLAALVVLAVPSFTPIASAAPVNGAVALKNAAPTITDTVRWGGGWRGGGWGWRGGGWRGGGWGWGFGGGLAAGALIGGALAAPYYYGGYYPYYAQPYYAPGPGYYAQPYGGDGGGDDGVAYCMQRYRSYNPNTGTFMGNDGHPHPCP